MAVNINGSAMPPKLMSELEIRGKSSNASPWKASKRPWIKLQSNAMYEGGGELPLTTLFGGKDTWTKEGMHDTSGRIVPKGGVTGVKVSTTGTAGTMRKVDVSFKMYSIEQLKNARKAFLIPGMTAIVSWGWNIKSDGTPTTQLSTTSFVNGMGKAQQVINTWIEGNDYATDASFGLISDFGWTFDPSDGSFDCKISMQTPSSAYLTTSIDVASGKNCGCKSSEDEAEEGDGAGSWVKQAIKNQADEKIKLGKPWTSGGKFAGTAIQLDEEDKEETGWWASKWNWMFGAKNRYVTWEWFESNVMTSGLAPEGSFKDIIAKAGGSTMQEGNGLHNKVWRLDSTGTKLNLPIAHVANIFSADPWVCLIPGNYHWEICGGKYYGVSAQIDYTGALPKQDNKGGEVNLTDMLINTHFLWNTYLESDKMDDFLMKLLNGMSDACGGIWEFGIVSDPDNPHVIRIQNKRQKVKASVKQFKLFGLNSPARSWGMTTDMPADLKNSIMMGANKEAGSGNVSDTSERVWGIYGGNIADKLYKGIKLSTTCTKSEGTEDCPGGKGNSEKITVPLAVKRLKNAGKELARQRDPESVDEAKGCLRALLAVGMDDDEEGEQLIPIGFEGTFDGIGGFKWGHLLKVKEVTDLMSIDYHAFQVTSVTQDVSISDWTTSIETGLRMRGEEG